jgi:hypothetical protein
MIYIKYVRTVFLLIPFALAITWALPGCGDDPSDLERAKSGAPLKTPSEVLKEAKAKAGVPDKASAQPGTAATAAPK